MLVLAHVARSLFCLLSHIHALRNGLLLECKFLIYQNSNSYVHPSKRIQVWRIHSFACFHFNVHYYNTPYLTCTLHYFNLHTCGSFIVKKMFLMSPKHFSNITTVMTNKTKQPLSILLVQTQPFCLLLLFQPLGKCWL